jgi:cytochrome c2
MKLRVIAACIIVAAGAMFLFSMEDAVDRGKQVFAAQKCSICHSIIGAEAGKVALDGVGAKLKPSDIKKWIKSPKDMKTGVAMKSYPNLPEKDLDDLTAYLQTLKN